MSAIEPQLETQPETQLEPQCVQPVVQQTGPETGDPAIVAAVATADIAPTTPLVEIAPADFVAIARLRSTLGITGATAQVLARRGYQSPAAAKEFLTGGNPHRDADLPGATEAVALLRRHLESGTPMAVHGDYDADGACSTALLVETLTRLGADVTWHVPDRFADGYGLGKDALERFANRGVGLAIAVDCGVTAVAEAEFAAQQGIELLILDHHERGAELPRATIVHPAFGEYPNPQMCATAVSWKVMRLLHEELGADAAELEQAVELVALATVTDVMPLAGENRWLVRRGIEAMRVTPRPGLRELMRAAGVDPLGIDATTFGFRLGPRLNAAGRMRSADAAVELLLTTSEQRAAQLADELHGLNAMRRDIEQEVLFKAQEQAAEQLDGYAIVVAGEGWHKGVLGIVAGRLAERHRRPCVALAISDGVAEGSGRNGGRYDLTGGLRECADELIAYGGHRAAAGLSLDAGRLDAFRSALRQHAAGALAIDDLRPRFTVDAVVDARALTLPAGEELATLGPFGNANPEPLLLVPGAALELNERMGASRQHARVSLATRGARTRAVAFDWQAIKPPGDGPWQGHAIVSLRRNEWRGSVEAQVQIRAVVPLDDHSAILASSKQWSELLALELAAPTAPIDMAAVAPAATEKPSVDRSGESPFAPLLELVSAGEVSESDARTIIDAQLCSREYVAAFWRLFDGRDELRVAELPMLAAAAGISWLDPVAAARILRVLGEVGLAELIPAPVAVENIRVVREKRVELDQSEAFRSYSEIRTEALECLSRLTSSNSP